ncbi:MAG: AraC family transcriptional regulator [Lentisphaeria bacterium]|nr:MAG: AraC family transcriptional regulator [Lentisphaeria bacterium]
MAAELGFGSEYYFSRFFHKNTGIPPRQYREFYRNMEVRG